MNKRFGLSLLAILLGVCWVKAGQSEFTTYYKDKRYTFTITSKRQSTCPKWTPEKEENPPLSAANALKKAEKFAGTVEAGKGYVWRVAELSLANVHGWLWRARFQLSPVQGEWIGPLQFMDCYILMDGTVVQPVVVPSTDRAKSTSSASQKSLETTPAK
jgi:hypothetical protein